MSDTLAALQDRTFARMTTATAGSYPPERRLTSAQLAFYLDRHVFAVVSSTRPDGRPHAAISGYIRREAAFWLPTVSGSVRERNIRSQPWVTLVITEGEHDEHVVVIIEGPAAIVQLPDVPEDIRSARSGDWVSGWIRVQAQRLLSYASEGAGSLA
jgi:general stress protein 26